MTAKEVAEDIKSKGTQYPGIMPQSTYYNTLSRIIKGTATDKTIRSFFEKFNYKVEQEQSWVKEI